LPRRVSEEKVVEALRLRFDGYSTREAANLTAVGVRTLNNRLRDFRVEGRKVGVLTAARSYGLEIDDLFNLAKELKEEPAIRVEDCRIGFEVSDIIVDLGVDVRVFKSFVEDVFLEAKKQDLSGAEIHRLSVEMRDIRKDSGLSYKQILKKYYEYQKDVRDLDSKISASEEELSEIKEAITIEVRNAGVTRSDLKAFVDTRNTLKNFGVATQDLHSLKNLLENIEELGHDPLRLVDFYKEHSEITEERNELKRDH